MDRKHVTVLVLFDLSKAFDSLERTLLLYKLRSLSLSKAVVGWFRSYLTDRMGFQMSLRLLINWTVLQSLIKTLFNKFLSA